MEKKAANNSTTNTTATSTTTTTAKPVGSMCEKLFHAINTNNTFRPLRLLTNKQQEPAASQSGTQSNNLPATAATTDAKHKVPSPPPPPQEKPKVAFTPSSIGKNDVKGTDKKDAPHGAKKDPKGNSTAHNPVPVPVPPKGAIMPHPAPPAGVASTTETTNTKPKKSLNEKIDDYINRTKVKLRSHSTVGRTSTTK